METTQHNNETQITERRYDARKFNDYDPQRNESYLPLEEQFQNLLNFFGSELDKAENEIHLDKAKRMTPVDKCKHFVNGNSSTGVLGALLLILLSSSLSAKDLCSKKGPDELLRSSSYTGKFFFKHDCKKRKTYFSEEQTKIVNDKLKIEREKEITITVRMANDENLIITANQKGIVKTGFRMSWSKDTLWDKDQKRLSQLGLAKWN